MAVRKKGVRSSSYEKGLQKIVAKYEAETGLKAVNLEDVVIWAEANGQFQMTQQKMRQKFRGDLAKALSKEFIYDENGEPVRKRHSFKNEKQLTLWKVIDDLTPDEMRISYSITRRRVGGEVIQKQRDIDYYNKHINPGDPIETSWNYDADIEDQKMSNEYPEIPPSDSSVE